MKARNFSKDNLSILFYLNKTRPDKDGLCPIYIRVTLGGGQITKSIKRSIHPKSWSSNGQPIGNSVAMSEIRNYMLAVSAKFYEHYNLLLRTHPNVTLSMLKDSFEGKSHGETLYLLPTLERYTQKMEELLDVDYSALTIARFKLLRERLCEFLKPRVADVDEFPLNKITQDLVEDFICFLKKKKSIGQNASMKYLQRLKRFTTHCTDKGWLEKNPLGGMKCTMKVVEREYLTDAELKIIMDKTFSTDRLTVVRDMFLFSCFTGLAYIDSKNLTKSQIEKAPDGTFWIRTHRQKTSTRSNIPLLPIPLTIINKYANLEELGYNKPILPLPSNQKMNEYLHEIADLCGINKKLTTHTARHTFATTVTLSNGVPIESVSKMLGHKDIKMTQHYARIVDSKVGEDMAILNSKISRAYSPAFV